MGSIQQGGQVGQHHEESKKASMNIKRKVHNEYTVLPVVVYGSETWARLKKAHMDLMSVAHIRHV